MIIDNEGFTWDHDDYYEIDTDKKTVLVQYSFDSPNDPIEDIDGNEVTPREWTEKVKQGKNQTVINELEHFLREHDFTIDYTVDIEHTLYNTLIFHLKTFKGIPKEMVDDWITSKRDLEDYKKFYRGKILSKKFGF